MNGSDGGGGTGPARPGSAQHYVIFVHDKMLYDDSDESARNVFIYARNRMNARASLVRLTKQQINWF